MKSGHPGMESGTAQSNAANQMLDDLEDTLGNAAIGPIPGGGDYTKAPLDPWPYLKNPKSRPLELGDEPGNYVWVQDTDGVVHIAPDGPHQHPTVLGGGQSATGAGTITIGPDGTITSVDNASGSFQFGGETLPGAVKSIEGKGFKIGPGAVKIFHW